MNTSTDRLSRWTPLIFACALINLCAGLLPSLLGLAWPAAPVSAPATLAMIHLLAVGWLTLLMFGALFQFVPVITNRKLPSQTLPLITLIGVEIGLAFMIAGFGMLGRFDQADFLLPAGGALVIAALSAGCATLLVPLAARRPMPLSARFILAGLGFLLLTILLGLALALALAAPVAVPELMPLLGPGVSYHALAGLGGWFTLTAIGVSYELLPMFMLAPHQRGVLGATILYCGATGFLVAFIVGIVSTVVSVSWIAAVEQIARLTITFAVALYIIDVIRLYRSRRRRQIELHNRAAVGAFVALAFALLLGVGAAATGRLVNAAPSLGLLILLGWLSGLGLAQLYKIIAFLSWLSRYGRQLGRGSVPRVQDLVNESKAAGFFVLYFAAVALAVGAAAFGATGMVRSALALVLTAILLLAREYVRAWRTTYAPTPAAGPHPPASSPLFRKESANDRSRSAHA
jgi:lipoprotein signal peptidase